MPYGCSDNNNLHNDDNKKLNIDSMSSMSIDEIVTLYKCGYRLEEYHIKTAAYSDSCTGTTDLVINNAAGATGPANLVTKGSVFAQRFYSTFRCLDWVQFLTQRLNNVDFKIEVRSDLGGLPEGAPNTSTGRILETSPISYSDLPTTIDYIYETISAVIQSGTYYWICLVPIDFYDSSIYRVGTVNYRFNVYDGTYVSNYNQASYYNGVWNGPYTYTAKMAIYKKSTYLEPPVFTSISITPTASSINIGSTQQFNASCLDQYGSPISCPTLTWSSVSSPSGFAPISPLTGLSTVATGNGACTSNISCTGGGKTSNTAVLTVVKVVYSITITPLTASLTTGATQQITAVCRDIGGNPLPSCPTLTWYTTNSSVATVNPSGLVTAGSTLGTANISCTGGGANSTAPSVITVVGPLNTITISPPAASLNVGNTQQLTAVCKDAVNNILTCPTLTWSSSSTSATVNSSGLVTAISGGTANISCTGEGKTSNFSVITIIAPANIDIQSITVGGTPCTGGCSVTCTTTCPATKNIVVTWTNSGGSNGTFTPWITVAGGSPIYGTQITITPSGTGITTFSSVSLPQGTPQICFDTGTIT